MLVDNNVVADSRVQKQARSSAAAGWDVTLLGEHRGGGTPQRWQIGRAKVQLVVVDKALNRRHDARRSGRLRSPLAYARPSQAAFRAKLVEAKTAEFAVDRAALKLDDAVGLSRHLRAASVSGRRVLLAVQRRWTALRAARTESLLTRRKAMTAPIDRLTTSVWLKLLGTRAWRVLDPSLWAWELAYGPVVDKLKPDIIHANDFKMLAVGARAALRGRARGRNVKLVWDVHEFLPGMRPWNSHPRWHIAQLALEREFAPYADAVVTVSDELADLLVIEHGLAKRPVVVANLPQIETAGARSGPSPDGPSVRESCGLPSTEPLMVYSGSISPSRGLLTVVQALPQLPGVHLALVVAAEKHRHEHVRTLLTRARELGASSRVHLLPYVPVEQIVPYLSTADVGLIPIVHYPNHEISLITKFYEYSHARLPIVVSDVKAMSAMVKETGQGEVFVAEDVHSFVHAVRAVLANPESYRGAYDTPGLLDEWTWDSAARRLDGVYAKLMEENRVKS